MMQIIEKEVDAYKKSLEEKTMSGKKNFFYNIDKSLKLVFKTGNEIIETEKKLICPLLGLW